MGIQESLASSSLAGLAPSGLGCPGWDPGGVLFWRVWETSDLGCQVLDIPGMAQRAERADIWGLGISRMWVLGPCPGGSF